jgi:HEAT repeat protein
MKRPVNRRRQVPAAIIQRIRRALRMAAWFLSAGTSAIRLPAAEPVAGPPATEMGRAHWIWADQPSARCELRRVVHLDHPPVRGTLDITADNGYEVSVNGSRVGAESGAAAEIWQSVERYDITPRLVHGRNIVTIRGSNLGDLHGVAAAVRIEFDGPPPLDLVTDPSWRGTATPPDADSSHPEYVETGEWEPARVVGPMGMAPWGTLAWSATARRPAAPPCLQPADPGADFRWPGALAFVGDDCSVYVPLRGDAWGVAFRVGDWSRAYTEFDLPCPSKIGRRLFILRPGPGAQPVLRLDAGEGVLGSPSASFDGLHLYVSMARAGDPFFHIYRLAVEGGGPVQLTDGPFHDLDPAELPDGRLVFASTRIGTFEEYHQPPSRALFRMQADGSGIEPISSTLIFDNEPKVMADGRIAFIRSDNFFDRGKVETHLHVMRPDGTDGVTEAGAPPVADYGNRLRTFGFGSPAPRPDGSLAFLSTHGALVAAPGSTLSQARPLPGPLADLAPLPDGRLLATPLRPGGRGMETDVLAVIDPADGSAVSVHRSTSGSIHSPVSLEPRPRPPVLPDYVDAERADRPGTTGFLFCQDARFTTKEKAGWDRVRAVRVLGAVPLTVRSSHSHIVHVGHETVELGTVPLAEDGSFFAEVPADTPLALQAVDAEGRSELNEMSWIYVRPGERRSCVGCHQPRETAPPASLSPAQALATAALRLTGQGDPHRFRGNNAGVTGLMDLQFDRFRELASLNRHPSRSASPLASARDDEAALVRDLNSNDPGRRLSAAQRLAVGRRASAAPALAAALTDPVREVRVAAALALAACGTRESLRPLGDALADRDPVVARAASVAMENLTGGVPSRGTAAAAEDVPALERRLIGQLGDPHRHRSAVIALGHIGGPAAAEALQAWVTTATRVNPYPAFVNDNRTDTFTFHSASPLNPRPLQEAVRSLGRLRDATALPLFRTLLEQHLDPTHGNLFLAEAVIDAVGSLASPEAESLLLDSFARLRDYWHYVGWYSDHPALYACHSSPPHARLLEALDALASSRAGPLAPSLIRSVPTDPDRALFPDNDDYEVLVGRLIRRGGRGPEVTDTCLALLGEPTAAASPEIQGALSSAHPAWAGHPGPEIRAAQILSAVCRDAGREPAVRAAFQRYVDRPEEPVQRALGNPSWIPVRHWVLFYLARTLGQLESPAAVDALAAVLADHRHEARLGRPDPSQPDLHFLHLDYTPCWRAAAAWALGRIGDHRAGPFLLGAVRHLDNATDVRHTAARALAELADPALLPQLSALAHGYPEISTRRALQSACTASAPDSAGRSLEEPNLVARPAR